MRGLAALSVTLTHYIAAFLPWILYYNYGSLFPNAEQINLSTRIVSSPFLTVLYNGHFPVLIFFVLSGYVLTLPYYESQNADFLLKRRLIGRYLRLNLPIMASIGFAWLLYKLGLISTNLAAQTSGSINWLASFYPANMTYTDAAREAVFDSILFGNSKFIPPLWTLRVEFIGSIYILLFYIFKPTRHTLIPIIAAGVLLYLVHTDQSIYYFSIFAGSLLHHVRLTHRSQVVCFAAGVYLGAYQHFRSMYGFLPSPEIWDIKTFYNTIGAIAVCASVLSGFAQRLLNLPLVQFFGKISFSIYLIHFLVLCSLSTAFYTNFPQTPPYIVAGLFLYLLVCISIAWVFERLIDRPAVSLSRRFSEYVCGTGLSNANDIRK